ncbi:MAG: hypothetical protein M0008_11480 [Actinomycetota bacterium]|nr:hypothetical protein [Actinomycetota bacterium]
MGKWEIAASPVSSGQTGLGRFKERVFGLRQRRTRRLADWIKPLGDAGAVVAEYAVDRLGGSADRRQLASDRPAVPAHEAGLGGVPRLGGEVLAGHIRVVGARVLRWGERSSLSSVRWSARRSSTLCNQSSGCSVCHEGDGWLSAWSHASLEMRVGPSEPPCRRRFQTTVSG